MVKRFRLPKIPSEPRSAGLASAIREELKGVSDSRLDDYLKAKKSLLRTDPMLSTYHDAAKVEKLRRSRLKFAWGKTPPVSRSERALSYVKGALKR